MASGGSSGPGQAGTTSSSGTTGSSGTNGSSGLNGSSGTTASTTGSGGSALGGATMTGTGGGIGGAPGSGGSDGGRAGGGLGMAGSSGAARTGMAGGAGAAGMGTGPAGMSSGCGRMPTIASSMYNNGANIPITAANMQRRYILSVPTNYDNRHPYRLIIAWHQRDGNDNQMYQNKYYHLQPLANNTAIFVAPNGQKGGAPCTGTGNADSGCGWPNPNDSDMALADAVVAQVEENFCIDTNRIFATGWSYGGSMSYATACERPLGATTNGKVGFTRAIAVYSGAQLSGSCKPSKPVAYYASHGTHDGVLNYSSGLTLAQNFATANGCTWMTPTEVTSGNHVCTNLTGCITGYPEEFCSFNGDHTPDPRDGTGGTSWEYQNVWNFSASSERQRLAPANRRYES